MHRQTPASRRRTGRRVLEVWADRRLFRGGSVGLQPRANPLPAENGDGKDQHAEQGDQRAGGDNRLHAGVAKQQEVQSHDHHDHARRIDAVVGKSQPP